MKLQSVHTPRPEEFGSTPDPKAVEIRCIVHSSQPGEPPVGAKAPMDIFEVCPNMPAIARGDDKDGPFWVIDCTKGDLAAWKATRTKRLTSRAAEGRLQLDPRTATEAIDPNLSSAAKRAWDTRRARAAEKAAEEKAAKTKSA